MSKHARVHHALERVTLAIKLIIRGDAEERLATFTPYRAALSRYQPRQRAPSVHHTLHSSLPAVTHPRNIHTRARVAIITGLTDGCQVETVTTVVF